MVYLASPYSSSNHMIQEARWRRVCEVAGDLIQRGHMVFSPIAHSHPIAKLCQMDGGFEVWKKVDLHMLLMADRLAVLELDGWDASEGVREEIECAEDVGVPVRYLPYPYSDDDVVRAFFE